MTYDPISPLEPLGFDSFSFSGKRASGSMANVAEFVDPQYIDQRYSTTQLGFITPESSPTDTAPRHESFALTESMGNYFSGSSAASSFMSHSGCRTPSLSTPGSSTSNSRRQSMLLPESQQHYLSSIPSSPSHRPQRPKRAAATDQCLLQESSPGSYIASTGTASLMVSTAACTPGGEFNMVVDDYAGKAPRQWQTYGLQSDPSSLYARATQPAQFHEPASWGRDLEAELSNPTVTGDFHTFGFNHPLLGHAQPAIFQSPAPQPDAEMYDAVGSSTPNTPSLAPPFEFDRVLVNDSNISIGQPQIDSAHRLRGSLSTPFKNNTCSSPSDDDSECNRAASPIVRGGNRRRKHGLRARIKVEEPKKIPKFKPHRCDLPDPKGNGMCPYACHRPEHLRRHLQSIHMADKTEMHPCAFDGCINRKTGQRREIIARLDNLKAHYTKTHFKYGSSEKGGKNDRKSMKAAHEMGLSMYDARWTLLLDEKMNINQEIKDYLHVWKMLGYSILETRDTKVKDVAPDWDCPEDDRLQKYDPRWKALWDGTLTLDKAMDKGKNMKESEAQGLLGVTMLETEAMGIRDLDPRWKALLNSRMSVEQSEKLGVRQRNPAWKKLVDGRRAR